MIVDISPPPDAPVQCKRQSWKIRLLVAVLASGLIALIWTVAINRDLMTEFLATALVLLVALLGLRTLEEHAGRDLAMAENQWRLLTAQKIGEMGEWSYDLSSGLVRWSSVLARLYGDCDRLEAPVDEIIRYMSPEERVRRDEALRGVMETGESGQYQRVFRHPDGQDRVHRVIIYPTRNSDGVITGFHGIDQDITTAKRLEHLESRLTDLARLDAMHLMAATLAHEINQPLTAAANYLAASRRVLTRTGTGADPDVERLIRSGEQQVRDAGGIVRRVRQMVMKEEEHAPVVVIDAWEKAVQLIEAVSTGKNIVFASDIGPGADVVMADAVQLGQVFTNLMRNAVEAVKEKMVVVGLTTRLEAGCVRLSIRDNGGGMPMFDSDFFTLQAPTRKGGLGLGLLISRTIVESHGGKIWVDSTSPEGTVVAFTLAGAPT